MHKIIFKNFLPFLLFVFATNGIAMELITNHAKDIKERVKIIFFENNYIKDLNMLIEDSSGAVITDLIHADHEITTRFDYGSPAKQYLRFFKDEIVHLLFFPDEETEKKVKFPLQVRILQNSSIGTVLSFPLNETDDRKKIIFKGFDYPSNITQAFYKGLAAFVKDKNKEIQRAKIDNILKADQIYPNSRAE